MTIDPSSVAMNMDAAVLASATRVVWSFVIGPLDALRQPLEQRRGRHQLLQLVEGEPGGQRPGELPGARVALVPEHLPAGFGDRQDDPPAVVRVRAAPDQAEKRPPGR